MKYKNLGWGAGYVIPNAKKCKFLQKNGTGKTCYTFVLFSYIDCSQLL